MSLPDAALLGRFSVSELRDFVGALVAEIGARRCGARAQQATISALRDKNQASRDEVTQLKGLPARPPLRPSGMEQATPPGADDTSETRPKSSRGTKHDQNAVTAEIVVKVSVSTGSRFKGM